MRSSEASPPAFPPPVERDMAVSPNYLMRGTNWQERLDEIMEMMRETSRISDPQATVDAYGRRMSAILPADRTISLSRRDLEYPEFRVTRYSGWDRPVNPWKEPDRLPRLRGGVLADLVYAGEPRIIDDFEVAEDDPAAEYLSGQRSIMMIPMLDQGESLNAVLLTREEPASFDKEQFPEIVWTTILFGRATYNLVLAEKVKAAYDIVDRELQIVGNIQRSLLPSELPEIPNMKLAAHYQTSQRAGGDYYDFFPLPNGRWGLLIADVSGHGTPAAVMMAVTHSIAHMFPESTSPSDMLDFVNRHLTRRYTHTVGSFVTAFYGIYDPASRELIYSSAGHNPPRIKHCADDSLSALEDAREFPLGITTDVKYRNAVQQLIPGDQLVFYTDGITEATNAEGTMFDVTRLDEVLTQCRDEPAEIIDAILMRVDDFTLGKPPADDRTVVVAKVS